MNMPPKPQLTRRKLLSSTAVGLIAGTAGCLGMGTEQEDEQSPDTTESTQATTQREGTTIVKTPPDRPTANDTETQTKEPPSNPSVPPLMSLSGSSSMGVDLSGTPVIGKKAQTPIDLYYWTDYQCRFCKQFENKTIPKLLANEVANGTVRVIMLWYPHYGPHSMTAAVMAKCAWQQVKDTNPAAFWNWHHTVFENQGLVEKEWSSRGSLLGYARNTKNLSAGKIEQCMNSSGSSWKNDVKAERKRAKNNGFTQTPSFIVHNPKTDQQKKFSAAQPYGTVSRHIQSLL